MPEIPGTLPLDRHITISSARHPHVTLVAACFFCNDKHAAREQLHHDLALIYAYNNGELSQHVRRRINSLSALLLTIYRPAADTHRTMLDVARESRCCYSWRCAVGTAVFVFPH